MYRKLLASKLYDSCRVCKSRLFHERRVGYSYDSRVQELFSGVKNGNRAALAQAITLVESKHPVKQKMAVQLLGLVLANNQHKSSFRIGFSGPPGAGKSSLIEVIGQYLTENNHKIAVLTVDPSSITTGGSLLGDKTRMPELSRNPLAYIRPSPTGGKLGGVSRATQEAVCLCECAGFDLILIETVGVGQSELAVSNMVDCFVLMSPPGAGDELQGMKRGVIECCDIILITKSDGELVPVARRAHMDYLSALKFMRRRFSDWKPQVLRVSARNNEGISEFWTTLMSFKKMLVETNEFYAQRERQRELWMWNHIQNHLLDIFKKNPDIKSKLFQIEPQVRSGAMTPGVAAELLLSTFIKS